MYLLLACPIRGIGADGAFVKAPRFELVPVLTGCARAARHCDTR